MESKMESKWVPKSIEMAPGTPFGAQIAYKAAPGRSPDALGHLAGNSKVDLSAFGMFRSGPLEGRVANGDFRFCGSFFEPFCHHFWKNSRRSIENLSKMIKNPSKIAIIAPRGAKNDAKERQRAPRGTKMEPKGAERGPKWSQRATKEVQNGGKGCQKEVDWTQKRAKWSRKGAKWSPKGAK